MIIVELIYNLSVLVTLSVLSGFIDIRLNRNEMPGKIIQGFLFGATAIVGMIYPFVLTEGIIFDGRSIVISLCTLFFGPVSGSIASLMAILFRINIGGGGTITGVLTIITSFIIGYYFYFKKTESHQFLISNIALYFFGVLVHAVMLLVLLSLPSKNIAETFKLISFTVIGVYPIATLLIGKILLDQEKNIRFVNQIKESEERLSLVVKGINEGIWDWDRVTNQIHFSERWKEILGYQNHEIEDNLDEWKNRIHPEDYEKVISANDIFFSSDKKYFQIEYRMLHKDGKYRWLLGRGTCKRNKDGVPIRTVGSHADITKRKKAEEAFLSEFSRRKLLFDHSPVGIIIIDIETKKFLEFNNVAHEQLGYTREEFSNLTVYDVEAKETLVDTNEKVKEVLSKGFADFETLQKTRDGEIRNVHVIVQILNDGNSPVYYCIWQDITERKSAELELQKSHELLTKLSERVPGVVYQYRLYPDGSSCFPYASPGMQDIYEVKPEDVIEDASPVFERIYKEDYGKIETTIQESARTLQFYNSEFRVVLPKKGLRWLLCEAKPEKLNDGSVLWYGIITDITARKNIEEKLLQSEERFRVLFEGAPDAIILADPGTGKILEVNNSACGLLGKNRDEIIGHFQNELHPKEIKDNSKSDFEKHFYESMTKGFTHPIENYIVNKNGAHVPVEVLAQVIKINNQDVLMSTFRDITVRKNTEMKLKESEELFRHSFEYSSAGNALLDINGKFIQTSLAFKFITGYDENDLKELTFSDITYHEDISAGLNKFNKMLNGEISNTTFEKRYVRKDKSIVWCIVTFSLIRNSQNEPLYFIAQIIDINDRKIAEQVIIESQRLNAIGEMSSAVAHDFNNSLQSITSHIELAMLNPDTPEQIKEFLKTANISARDAATRVQLLQRFGGKKHRDNQFKNVNLNLIVNDVITQSRPLWKDSAQKNGIIISLETELNEVDNLNGNEAELKSVLYNLIKNSVEAMPEGGKIKIETGQINDELFVRVIDNGTGMDEKTKFRIFQPFFSTKGFEAGRGMGLSGAYSIIKEHNGKIYVKETTHGLGTTIEILLPITNDNEIRIENDETPIYKGSAKILWVDDDPAIREAAVLMLEAIGHRGDIAEGGVKALELLDKNKYDLLFTDIGMPGMSGWQLCAAIKEKFDGNMKIAVLSGWGAEIDNEQMKKYNIKFVLEKPFQLNQLQQLINKAMID